MAKVTRLFNNSRIYILNTPVPLVMYDRKYHQGMLLNDTDYDNSIMNYVYDLMMLCKKYVYSSDSITYDDITKIIFSSSMSELVKSQPQLSELINISIETIKELTVFLITNDIIDKNIYIQELSENTLALEVEA